MRRECKRVIVIGDVRGRVGVGGCVREWVGVSGGRWVC